MDDEWEMSWRRPAAVLSPFIAGYTAYRQTGGAPGTHRGLPSPYLTMIVAVDDPVTILAHPDPADAAGDFWTLVGGLHTRPAIIGHPGRQAGIQLAINPLGVRALFGLPAGELSHRDVRGDDLLGPVASELHERVNGATTWNARLAAVDTVLARVLRPDVAVRPEVSFAWQRILATGGAVTIAALAAEVGFSSRHLDTTMRRETGLGPKSAAKVVRFDRAKRMLMANPRTVAEVAAACGYFDQAHLARDFRDLAGCSPSRWLAEEFRNVQAETDGPLADLMV